MRQPGLTGKETKQRRGGKGRKSERWSVLPKTGTIA